jgi:hypothetical protein
MSLPARVTFLLILAVHLWAVNGTIAWQSLFSGGFFYQDDFALHFARAAIVAAELSKAGIAGRLWVYDPSVMAGYPLGATVFDLDNVGTAVLMALLPVSPAVAFNLVVWACLVLAPLVLWAAARLLGCTRDEAVAATAAATIVTAAAITFRLGMFADFAGTYLVVLVVALAARHLAHPRLGSFLALVAVGSLGLALHVLVGVVALVPCAILAIGEIVRNPRRAIFHVLAVSLALVVLGFPWLLPFLRFAPVLGVDYPSRFFQTGTLVAAWGTLTVLSGWYLLLLALAAAGFALWARRVPRLLAVAYAVWVVVLLLAGLQGSRIAFLSRLQPARLMLPMSFALCPLAGVAAVAIGRRVLRAVGGSERPAVLLAALVFLPHLIITLRTVAPVGAIAATLPAEARDFVTWVRSHTDRTARVMVEDRLHQEQPPRDADLSGHPYFDGHFLAVLPQLTGREQIGGPYPEMPITPHTADFASGMFFGRPLAEWSPGDFAAQLERYNIGWIIAWSSAALTFLDAHPAIAEPVDRLDPFRMFRVRGRTSYFLAGSGTLQATYNRIDVADASAAGVTLKYHWFPGFCSDPPLPVRPHAAPGLAAPFIAIENGTTRTFTLRPTRDWFGRCR